MAYWQSMRFLAMGNLNLRAARIGKNVDSVRINKYNDHYIMNGIGGMQHYGGERNPESGILWYPLMQEKD